MPAVDVLAGLNPEQRRAVEHVRGPLLVVAGAGSGKTRVITHRIAHLIQAAGVRPDRILAITFTNKAAGEMQERIQALLGLRTPWICTFHAAGLRFLNIERHRAGKPGTYTICDEDEPERYVRQILKDSGREPRDHDPRAIAQRISQWKNQLVDWQRLAPEDDFSALCQEVACRYHERLEAEDKLDFDDLLLKPVRMLEADAALRARWQERFPYILVDEYQDTNEAQYRLLRLLGEHRNVCATGDPDQAIYGWRGADYRKILNFREDFHRDGDPVTVVTLETNYRSTKTILRAAQAVIEHNRERFAKAIRTDNADGKPIVALAVDDEIAEADAIAQSIAAQAGRGRSWRDFAVFYRTNAMSRVLEDRLRVRAIPYRLHGGLRFYDREEVKHLIAYLKLLVNPRDSAAFARICNVPKRGFGEATRDQVLEFAAEREVPVMQVFEDERLFAQLAVGRALAPLQAFARVWRLLRTLPLGDPVACVRGVIELADLASHYAQDPAAGDRLDNMREVITAAEHYRLGEPQGGLAGFLEVVGLNASNQAREDEGGDDRVQLMTLHAAKGLEFPVVFIAGLEEGLLPLLRGNEVDERQLEEERRLMYVGITRARQELYLSWARSRMLRGQVALTVCSRFLEEIPRDCLRLVGEPRCAEPAPAAAAPPSVAELRQRGLLCSARELQAQRPTAGLPPLRVGQRIRHSVFGPGVIRDIRAEAADRTLLVEFPAYGLKALSLAFAAAAIVSEP
ncbi:MAG: UvrD-helicase domain-containing protein [Planctomycetota bacterium]|nr:UvrD-helicase domain-containing protein [Planctomycetota bacterium]